jgi:integrase/recombinase XerC
MEKLIAEFLDSMRTSGLSERTIDRRKDSLGLLNRELPFGLAGSSYEELAAALARPDRWSPQTRASYTGDVRAFFRWACDPLDPRLDFDPAVYLKQPKVPRRLPRPVSDEELTTILTRADEPFRFWSKLAAYAGLRCCEIAGLDKDHITAKRITVLGKGAKAATVPTHSLIWEAVQELPPGPVAAGKRRERLTSKDVSSRASAHFQDLGLVGRVTMHRLRHWYGTMAQEVYGDLRVTQELLRHASPATTAVYTLVTDARRADAVALLPRVA